VELDSPWWSPAPDKTWRWPLFDKSWPLGEPLGINASLDYVLGSGEWPKVEVKKPKFDMDKFMSDMIHDRTQGKVSAKEQKKGSWKERNSKAAAPPKPAGAAPPTQPLVTAKASSKAGKKTGTPVAKGDRTADGRRITDLKSQATKKGAEPGAVAQKPPGKMRVDKSKDLHAKQLAEGLAALQAVTDRYSKDGATPDEVKAGVKSVRRKFKVFKSINVIDGGKTWDYDYSASPGKKKRGPKKKKEQLDPQQWPAGTVSDPIPIKWYKHSGIYPTIGGNTPLQGVTLPRTPRKDPLLLKVSDANFIKEQKVLRRREPGRPDETKKEDVKYRLDREKQKRGGLRVSHRKYAIDHVRDLAWFGRDVYTNLWPLNPRVNNAVNASHYQYARAKVGNKVETHSVSHWGSKKVFWIAKVIDPPGRPGGHKTSGSKPVNDGTQMPRKKS